MEPTYDNAGFLTKVKGKFGYSREVSLTKWNEKLFVYINDNSKCWDNGTFDKTKGKCISFNWIQANSLRTCLQELEAYASQIEAELLTGLPNTQQAAAFNEPFEGETVKGPVLVLPGETKQCGSTKTEIIYQRNRYHPY